MNSIGDADIEQVLYGNYNLNELIFTILKALQSVSRDKFFGKVTLIEVLRGVDSKKVFEMDDEEAYDYIYSNPELNLEKRYDFAFNEDEMEEILQGLLEGISVEVLKNTYCKYEILDEIWEDVGISFKYKNPKSLYNKEEMALARICLNEGMEVDKVNYFLKKEKNFEGVSYSLFNISQMKTIIECFKRGLTMSNLDDFLAFRETYIDGMFKKVCICTPEEILEAIEMFKE